MPINASGVPLTGLASDALEIIVTFHTLQATSVGVTLGTMKIGYTPSTQSITVNNNPWWVATCAGVLRVHAPCTDSIALALSTIWLETVLPLVRLFPLTKSNMGAAWR